MFILCLKKLCLNLTRFFTLTQVTRDYDEEEQGYDSEKERAAKDSDESGSSPARYEGDGEANSAKHTPKQAKQNGDDHNEEQDMDVSD